MKLSVRVGIALALASAIVLAPIAMASSSLECTHKGSDIGPSISPYKTGVVIGSLLQPTNPIRIQSPGGSGVRK